MGKLSLLVTILLAASLSVAEAQSKKQKAAEPVDPNANTKKLLVDGLPLVMPSGVMYYMLYQKQREREEAERAKGTKAVAKKKPTQ